MFITIIALIFNWWRAKKDDDMYNTYKQAHMLKPGRRGCLTEQDIADINAMQLQSIADEIEMGSDVDGYLYDNADTWLRITAARDYYVPRQTERQEHYV